MRTSGSSSLAKATADLSPSGEERSAEKCRAPAFPSTDRETVTNDAPRSISSLPTRWPIPPEPPVSTILRLESGIAGSRIKRDASKNVCKEYEHSLGHMDDRLLIV